MSRANGAANPWTDEQFALLKRMRADGKSWDEIGQACGHSWKSCKATYSHRLNGRKRDLDAALVPLRSEPGSFVLVAADTIADRDARYQAWLRQSPVAAALMGDPLPGRSALDQRKTNHEGTSTT